MVATCCAVCSHPLVDAKSVEVGLGPDCRRKYGYNAAMPEEARAEANKVVYHIALAQDGPYVVEGCNRLRELGFVKLADRILKRTAPVSVAVEGDRLVVSAAYDPAWVEAMRGVPGRRWDRERKVNTVPMSARASLEALVVRMFPGRVTVWPEGARLAA
jgi:hypothetical protein